MDFPAVDNIKKIISTKSIKKQYIEKGLAWQIYY